MLERKDVAFLELAVVVSVLLDGIVGQVHHKVVSLRQVVSLRAHPHVALPEVEALVLVGNQHPQTDIELPLADE